MSTPQHTFPSPAARRADRPRDSVGSWPLVDRVAYLLCWTVGIGLCAVAGAIVVFMLVKGIAYVRPILLVQSPSAGERGYFRRVPRPDRRHVLLTAIGTAIAAPLGVAMAVWLNEYARPAWLARAVESGVEMIAGTPSVVLAIFGCSCSRGRSWRSVADLAGGSVFGRSFLTAGAIMALLAIPLILGSTREGLAQVPRTCARPPTR